MKTMAELMDTLPQQGRIEWIGLRPKTKVAMQTPASVAVIAGSGLEGDRYKKQDGKRQVSFIQGEHLDAVGAMLGEGTIDPARVRRNVVVRGLNLLALKGKRFTVGDAVFEYTEPCHPCSQMEAHLGPGGYNAMRGHGAILARVLTSGDIHLGDPVRVLLDPESALSA